MSNTSLNVIIDRDVPVEMSDGVRLTADIYRPGGAAASPVLVHRTAYGKNTRSAIDTLMISPLDAVAHGYAVLVQDVRGTFGSEGKYAGYGQERADGHDTISWAADQSWSSGRVGIYGSSYMGLTSSQAVVDAPAALKACIAYMTSPDFSESWVFSGGVFEMGFNIRWWLGQAVASVSRSGADEKVREAVMRAAAVMAADPIKFFSSTLDVLELAGQCGEFGDLLKSWLRGGPGSAVLEQTNVLQAAERNAVPILTVAGWHDAFIKGGIDLHNTMVERSDPGVRDSHRLIIGPWSHESYLAPATISSAGVLNFGRHSAGGRDGLAPTFFAWFDRWLKDVEETEPLPPIKYFHMGPNIWRSTPVWPPTESGQAELYLSSGGFANSSSGDGRLVRETPTTPSPVDSYVYDPTNAVPTVGGRTLLYFIPGGPQDQKGVAERDDVLVYTSERLAGPLTVVGGVGVKLFVRSSAPTTDFMATLVDVDLDGRGLNVADGCYRLSPVADTEAVRSLTIDLTDTAYTFQTGHQVRLQITSSSFPRYDRNRNVDAASAPGDYSIAAQVVLHDNAYPSSLILDVVAPGVALAPAV